MNRETTKLIMIKVDRHAACQAYALYQPSFTADLRKDPSAWVEALNESDWHKVQNVSKHHSPTGPTDAKIRQGVV